MERISSPSSQFPLWQPLHSPQFQESILSALNVKHCHVSSIILTGSANMNSLTPQATEQISLL